MLAIGKERTVSLEQAAKSLPGWNGRSINASTVWRWIVHGTRAIDGTVVCLEAIKVGGRWITTLEALDRFLSASNARAEGNALETTSR